MKTNVAGRLAGAFLNSKLTPLLMVGSLLLGVWTLATMASEEEPQIIVPLADLYLPLPGASPEEVENRLLIPLEGVLQGIEGVEYVYGHAETGFGLVTVRYEVGRDMEQSLVRLYSTLFKNMDRMPPGFVAPLVKTVTIDDVPFFTATLTSETMGPSELRRIADEVRIDLSAVPEVRDVSVIGGETREIRVEPDPARMVELGIDAAWIAERLQAVSVRADAGEFTRNGEVVRVAAGPFLTTADDVSRVVLDVRDGGLIQVGDVARVLDGPGETTKYTLHTDRSGAGWVPMVTVAVAKRPGADATRIGRALEARLADLDGHILTDDIDVRITRNYGETAREKVVTLQEHLGMAILAVGLVVALTMGWRAAVVVMTAVPITFALTLFVYQIFGYTLNRVTLFALIFVTGIVIDDSIIVAENMERHFKMRGKSLLQAARDAVDEVGNPTILATLTVIAAVLPMLFVGGLMGPYMSPMPVGATMAMLFSLAVALMITPWLSYRLLKGEHGDPEGEGPEHGWTLEESGIYRAYARIMVPLLDRPSRLWAVLGVVTILLLGSASMFLTRTVPMKMLPFDDKNEMQVILDFPEGTPLETTLAVAQDAGRAALELDEVIDVQLYAGTAAPFNFNGMIRHYYLRSGSNVADIQVNLSEKGERAAQSHDVALALRPLVQAAVDRWDAGVRVKVVEVPPGPPVLSTLVTEIYGPDQATRETIARAVAARFEAEPGIVDVDTSLRDTQTEIRWDVDPELAALAGIDKARAVRNIHLALGGMEVARVDDPTARTPVPIRVRFPEAERSGVERLDGVHVVSVTGSAVPVSAVTSAEETTVPQVIDRKNGQRVVYVMADVAGGTESPVYSILDVKDDLVQVDGVSGEVAQLWTRQPGDADTPVLKWDGEWQITFEVFRDLGIAFGGALLLIYVLIVAWFGSFTTPLVMMAAIPLTLVGIAPGHFVFDAFFTATSMIGMIALAGIMVRNGILLIDYLEARIEDGVPVRDAVLEAGAVRTRPIALTAGTVVIGAVVILFDPIFQGLAVALIAGAIASTVLTLVVVPGIYFLMRRNAPAATPAS